MVVSWTRRLFGGSPPREMGRRATDEVLFREAAHGLLAWALATIIVVALLIVGSAVAGAVAAATPAPAAPVSPEAAEAARKAATASLS